MKRNRSSCGKFVVSCPRSLAVQEYKCLDFNSSNVYRHSVHVFSFQLENYLHRSSLELFLMVKWKEHHRTSLNSPNSRANDWWLTLYSIQIWTPLPRWFHFEKNTFSGPLHHLHLSCFIVRFRCWFVVNEFSMQNALAQQRTWHTFRQQIFFNRLKITKMKHSSVNENFPSKCIIHNCCFYDAHILASLHDAILTNIIRMHSLLWIRNYVDCIICIKNQFKKEKSYKMRD